MQLRIAFSVYRGNPLCGGQGVYTHYLTKELQRLGHFITVFAGQPYPQLEEGINLVRLPSLDMYRDTDPFRWPQLREIDGITDLAEIAIRLFGGFPEPRTFSMRLAKEINYSVNDFDILHDNQSLGSGIKAIANRQLPVIASIHHPVSIDRYMDIANAKTIKDKMSKYRWYGFSGMQERVARNLPKIITVSEQSKADIISYMAIPAEKVEVIPAGVDTDVFYPDKGIKKKEFQIMTVISSDVHLKGMSVLMKAMNIVAKENPAITLVVVGKLNPNGPAYKILQDSPAKSHIRFMHNIPEKDLASLYRESTLAVVPSLYEGFSLPSVQALASGIPVVATTGGALPEVLGTDGDCALLVEPGNADHLARAIMTLIRQRDLREKLAEAGLKRVYEKFTWTRAAEKITDQYTDAISKFRVIR